MALSTAIVPSLDQLTWMWIGSGVGALVSLPVYLFYLAYGPPAKRALVFSAPATTVGIVLGGVFGPALGGVGLSGEGPRWARLDYLTPVPLAVRFGFSHG